VAADRGGVAADGTAGGARAGAVRSAPAHPGGDRAGVISCWRIAKAFSGEPRVSASVKPALARGSRLRPPLQLLPRIRSTAKSRRTRRARGDEPEASSDGLVTAPVADASGSSGGTANRGRPEPLFPHDGLWCSIPS